ncbi:zinc ribbon domain-containing protein [Clostridium psychrophilum]|uniref:zinc ribbon domain-containing protein n=1 Tax=Clostridium psychrophilum TaxID=132926 RepID=UPI001C0D2836|nr:zinc-ribbon domain-containing protein [Clostridium psychrophilum]MBU3182992.1 zinc-ribbon domain-containing protein [Clostridium psychrophilum]
MKFCSKCGNEINEDQTFCTTCGNDLKNESTNETPPIEENTSTENSLPKEEYQRIKDTNPAQKHTTSNNKLTKKSKISIIVAAVLIVAIIAIVQVGNYLSDPKKLEARFQKDVVTNNVSDLANTLYCNDTRLTVDNKNVVPLLDYFKKNPSYYDEVIENLNNDALSPKDLSNINISSSNTLTLTNIGKKFLIFPNYKINVKPSFVDITTTVKDVNFSLNNTQIGKSDTDKSTKEFGPYIPGTYLILANYKGKYVTLNHPYQVDLIKTSNGTATLSVFEDMNYLNISSDYPDAKIFVNSKDTNVKVSDATNFGPVDTSSKIYATTVIGGKTLKSEEQSTTSGETDINISFQDAINAQTDVQAQLDDVKSQLNDLLQNYASGLTAAINANDFSLVSPYLTYGSKLYTQQQANVPGSHAGGDYESLVSANITDFNISDDSQSGTINTSETYNFVSIDGTSINKSYSHVYKFQYNGASSGYQFTNRQ